MERFILIGAYEKELLIERSKCIDIIYGEENVTQDSLEKYIIKNHMNNLEKYDILFLISENLEVISRIVSFAHVDFLRREIDETGNLTNYSPIYMDSAEHDERVLLSILLDVDTDDIENRFI